MRTAIPLLLAALAVGCAPANADAPEARGSTVSNQFFENSARRDANALEASYVAKLGGGCTSFFLENTAGKVYMATARHCVEFKVMDWCESDGAITDNAGVTGRCTKVVAADQTRDFAIFEVAMVHPSSGASTLRLAAYTPPQSTKLTMTGYPGDKDPATGRNGKLTTTENCWVMGNAPFIDTRPFSDGQASADVVVQHNCSTYGGNSGGPMVAVGTRDAIGLPATFQEDDYVRRSSTDLESAAWVGLMSFFVEAHRAELTAAGIAISDTPSSAAAPEPPPVTVPAGDTTSDEETVPSTDADDDAVDSAGEDDAPSKPKTKPKKTSTASPPANAAGCSAGGHSSSSGAPLVCLFLVALVLGGVRRRAVRAQGTSQTAISSTRKQLGPSESGGSAKTYD